MHTHTEIYFDELARVIMEPEKSHDLPPHTGDPGKLVMYFSLKLYCCHSCYLHGSDLIKICILFI